MNRQPTDLDALWQSAPRASRAFDPQDFARLPASVQRYLGHAIAPGTPLASAVRLRMHGQIRLGKWRHFKAEQVIVASGAMIWRARVRLPGLSIRGFDRYVDGKGVMQWRLFGIIPFIGVTGRDVTRSAAGRLAAESVWLPSMLCEPRVTWTANEGGVAHANFTVGREAVDVALALDHGCLQFVALSRWGNPDGGAFRPVDFGAMVEQEATFGGYTIPARVRAGWYFGTERFESEGEFLRVTIDDARYA
jgi:hypothetical protein